MLRRLRLSPKCDLREAEGNIGELESAALPLRLETNSLFEKAERDAGAVFDKISFAGKAFTIFSIFFTVGFAIDNFAVESA